MRNSIPNRLPQFSIGSLFLFVSAVALGFAASRSAKPQEPLIYWSSIYQYYYPVSQGFLVAGSLVVLVELLRQSISLRELWTEVTSEFRFSLAWLIAIRLGVAGLIFSLALIRLLLNQGILAHSDRHDIDHIWGDLWPDIMLVIALILGLRVMLMGTWQIRPVKLIWFRNATVLLGAFVVLTYVVVDRVGVTALVHLAVENVEYSYPMRYQRPDVYPSHQAEGYRSFWQAAGVAWMSLLAITLLLVAPLVKRSSVRLGIWMTLATLVVGQGAFALWFVLYEFPRLSPELASAGSASVWTDVAAGLLLLLGVVGWLGTKSAARVHQSPVSEVQIPNVSGLACVGAITIALVGVCNWLVIASVQFGAVTTLSRMLNWGSLTVAIQWIGTLVFIPEQMIQVALFFSAISLLWQALRSHDQSLQLPALELRHVLGYSLAWLLLLLVALPCFAIFGFCYWLGPWF